MLSFSGKHETRKPLRNNTPLYILAKSPGLSQLYPPNKLAYYTLSYRIGRRKELQNVLVSFTNESVSVNLQRYLTRQECVDTFLPELCNPCDDIVDVFMYKDIYIHTTDFENAKKLSNAINMPLLVILPKQRMYVYTPL
jgi:hypothetical protein